MDLSAKKPTLSNHGTTLKPNQKASICWFPVCGIPAQFRFQILQCGLDEPWELGQGWSKKEVEKTSKGAVYLRHLEGIRGLVEKHGKNMQFWSDVLLEDPENAKLLDKDASPIIWGYEPSHPYEKQAKAIAECGLKFCLAPGSNWKSFTGSGPLPSKILVPQKAAAGQMVFCLPLGDWGTTNLANNLSSILHGAQRAGMDKI